MPNTRPAIDSVATIQHIAQAATRANNAEVLPIAAATVGRSGKELSPMRELVEAGAIGFSDDGTPVSDPAVMRTVFEYIKMLGVPYFGHCEDMVLSKGWGMPRAAAALVKLPNSATRTNDSICLSSMRLFGITYLKICAYVIAVSGQLRSLS